MSPEPPRMVVTGDTIPVRYRMGRGMEVLLVRRGVAPYEGTWALPGGFVEMEEDLADAAARELKEETGAEARVLDQVGAWGTPGRDPRGRTVTVAYLAVMGPQDQHVEGADDAAAAAWHPLDELPELAFDHADILSAALRQLNERCRRTGLALAMLPDRFTLSELQGLLDCCEGVAPADRLAEQLERRGLVEREYAATGGEYRLRRVSDDYLARLDI